ncbi:MAG: peptide ABC transporter substrate-binding protein [Candidatus Limnocylindrales bacterium]
MYVYPWPLPERSGNGRRGRILVACATAALALILGVGVAWHPAVAASARNSVTILGPAADSLDPAVQSDAGSAQVVSQLFESLTAVDSKQHVQPALASSWETQDGGKRVVFHLRPGLTFSDGTALTASDVVKSWMRVLDPAHPSPLASLIDGIVGARAYREGSGPLASVGIHSSGSTDVQVDLTNPAADFPAIVSGPTLAVVPPNLDSKPSLLKPGGFVGSGAYVLSGLTDTETTLAANPRYWAGKPAITTVHLLSSTGGKSSVEMFQTGDLDYTPIYSGDASWVAYDETLGPSLRIEPSPSVEFYGFNTTKPPFNDVHVRRAFALGIDWRRIVTLLSNPLVVPATGMVPDGVPGHSATDYGPKFDLAKAKSELAAAGYPSGVGFPKVTLETGGLDLDAAIVRQLHDNLGIDISYLALDAGTYDALLGTDPPTFWQMGWVADYPGANDFLGILLGSGQLNNFGRWANDDFDAAVSSALAASNAATMQQAFDRAQAIVQDQVPVIPVDFGAGYALAAKGLLGALPNSQGLVRYAGLAWASGS